MRLLITLSALFIPAFCAIASESVKRPHGHDSVLVANFVCNSKNYYKEVAIFYIPGENSYRVIDQENKNQEFYLRQSSVIYTHDANLTTANYGLVIQDPDKVYTYYINQFHKYGIFHSSLTDEVKCK